VGGHVLARDRVEDPRPHAEEVADPVQGGYRLRAKLPVANDEHLVTWEQGVQMLELLAVPAQVEIAPEGRPARGGAPRFGGARRHRVADRLQAGRPQMRPVGVRPLDRIAEYGDHASLRNQLLDTALSVTVVQVERGALAAQAAKGSGVEQRLVVRAPPDVFPIGLRVAGAAAAGWRAVRKEELGLFDARHEQVRMAVEPRVQGRGARLRHPDDQEVRQRHRALPGYQKLTAVLPTAR
jgi:hypothetical protein